MDQSLDEIGQPHFIYDDPLLYMPYDDSSVKLSPKPAPSRLMCYKARAAPLFLLLQQSGITIASQSFREDK